MEQIVHRNDTIRRKIIPSVYRREYEEEEGSVVVMIIEETGGGEGVGDGNETPKGQ